MLIQTRLQKPLLNGHPQYHCCTFDFEPIKIPTDYYSHLNLTEFYPIMLTIFQTLLFYFQYHSSTFRSYVLK